MWQKRHKVLALFMVIWELSSHQVRDSKKATV